MKLHVALGISTGDVVAFVGAGGKSGAILQVAAELAETGMTVLTVPTTKMSIGEATGVGTLVTSEAPNELRAKVKVSFSEGNVRVAAGSAMISRNRVGGVAPDLISDLAPLADVLLVEADGSRGRPVKGTAAHEPALPDASTIVVAVANVEALGSTVDEEHVHRPAVFSELTGVGPGQSINARAFALALVRGSLARVPAEARTAVLITGVQPGRTMSDASVVSRELWRLGTKRVVLTSIPNNPPAYVWIP